MSNLRGSGYVPLKTSMTNKWKAQAPNSEMLERQTRALEESLNKLKIAMHPEKGKTNAESNGPIWDKGKTGPLTQYANHVLRDEPRRVFDANKPTKIRVLGDEPPATVVRPSLVANLFNSKPTTTNTVIKCGQCEKGEAKVKCLECAESYCTGCFAHFHLRGALQRHRCVPLNDSRPATPQKKRSTVGADVIFKELRYAQSKDDLFRQSVPTEDNSGELDDFDEDHEYSGGALLRGNYDEKSSAQSFQQALKQWRQGGDQKKSKGNHRKTHEAQVDTVYDSNGKINQIPVPKFEFNSSKLTYGEKLLLKKHRRANQTNHETSNGKSPRTGQQPKTTPRQTVVHRSLTEKLHQFDTNINIQPLYDEPITDRPQDTERTITPDVNGENEEDEELLQLQHLPRTKSRASAKGSSRPNSSAKGKNPNSSRPTSAALFQHPLPSLLSTNPGDELKSIIDAQPQSSRPSSAALKKPSRIDTRLPTMWNRNWKPEQSVSDGVDEKTIRIDQQSLVQFDSALEDLLDENKIELANRSATVEPSPPVVVDPTPVISPMKSANRERESVTPTPGRQSMFTFTDSPRKLESVASIDGGFFTDVKRKKPEQPPSTEWKTSVGNRSPVPTIASLRKTSIENFSPPPPKRSTTREETRSILEDQSRPTSSLSSASLPVSIISSQPDNITRPSIERHPKVAPMIAPPPPPTAKKFRVEFPKKPSPTAVQPMVIEGKKVTSARQSARDSDEYLQSSMNATRSKISSGTGKLSVSNHLVKTSSTSSMTSVTRDDNLLRDESLTIADANVQKSATRKSIVGADREPTKARKIEFSVRDGMKWQQGSTESGNSKNVSSSVPHRSSRTTTPRRPSTPSNPTNTKLGSQFSTYDVDDGRSSRACQDVNDEECFNQLREELTSELGMASPGWDASLSEHVLKNLRVTDVPFNEKELQENLNMLEIKLRENESIRRSQTDDDFSVHEEIRNL